MKRNISIKVESKMVGFAWDSRWFPSYLFLIISYQTKPCGGSHFLIVRFILLL